MENLTSEQVEQKIKEINKIDNHGERNKALIDLCHEVGAPPCPKDMGNVYERDAEHIRSIRETLKTKEAIQSSKIVNQQLRVTWIGVFVALAIGLATLLLMLLFNWLKK